MLGLNWGKIGVYSDKMNSVSPENNSVFELVNEGDFACVLSIFHSFCLWQSSSPLFGLFRLVPGFVEIDEVV